MENNIDIQEQEKELRADPLATLLRNSMPEPSKESRARVRKTINRIEASPLRRIGLEQAEVKPRKRATATGIFTGVVSVATVAACLAIVIIGIMGRSKSKTNAASPSLNNQTVQTAQPTESPTNWNGITKVIALSSGFDFANEEKYSALYKGILAFLRDKGESEPDELWLCGIKSRYVKEDTGKREDGYLSGYYVLAQHAFGEGDGPELYCLSEDYEVLWCTEGSVSGPNHAVNPKEDTYAGNYQRHFLYGTEPMIAEPGIPHVKRGAVVGEKPGTDIEFSMAASITEVQSRLADADSAYPGAAWEYFLVTVPDSSWDYVMQAHTLRFETEEGPVDVDMETELPEAKVVMLTTSGTEEDIYRSLELGAKGYVMKDGDTGEIMEAIRTVAAGGRFVPEPIRVVYERRAAAPEMTEREIETLRLAAEGRTNREIAEALGLSEVTVKVRLTGIFAKLGARDRVDAVNRAVARGLVPPRA